MPILPTTVFVQTAALLLLLATAVGSDVQSRRIPNRLVLIGIVLALVMHLGWLALGHPSRAGPDWWSPIAGLAAGFALLLPVHLLRAMGAGDVKLMAMVGAFVGAPTVVVATLYTFVAGGLLALIVMLGRGVVAQTFANLRFLLFDWILNAATGHDVRLAPLQTTAARLPYALAIALGTGAALIWPLAL